MVKLIIRLINLLRRWSHLSRIQSWHVFCWATISILAQHGTLNSDHQDIKHKLYELMPPASERQISWFSNTQSKLKAFPAPQSLGNLTKSLLESWSSWGWESNEMTTGYLNISCLPLAYFLYRSWFLHTLTPALPCPNSLILVFHFSF